MLSEKPQRPKGISEVIDVLRLAMSGSHITTCDFYNLVGLTVFHQQILEVTQASISSLEPGHFNFAQSYRCTYASDIGPVASRVDIYTTPIIHKVTSSEFVAAPEPVGQFPPLPLDPTLMKISKVKLDATVDSFTGQLTSFLLIPIIDLKHKQVATNMISFRYFREDLPIEHQIPVNERRFVDGFRIETDKIEDQLIIRYINYDEVTYQELLVPTNVVQNNARAWFCLRGWRPKEA